MGDPCLVIGMRSPDGLCIEFKLSRGGVRRTIVMARIKNFMLILPFPSWPIKFRICGLLTVKPQCVSLTSFKVSPFYLQASALR